MTLIWGGFETCPYMAADRLTTLAARTHVAVFDEHENKLLVVQALDALMIIGYSGTAYVDGTPFDQWLAKIIFELMPAPDAMWANATIMHDARKLRSAAHIAFILKKRISLEKQIQRCELVFTGFWRRKHAVAPLLHRWVKGWRYNSNAANPFGATPANGDVAFAGDAPSQDTVSRYHSEVMAEITGSDGDRLAARRVATVVQKCAAASPVIGDCVNVVWIDPNCFDISVEFFQGTASTQPRFFAGLEIDPNCVISPWLLFSTLTQAPTMMSTNVSLQGYPVVRFFNASTAPHNPGSRVAVLATQERKSWNPS